MARYAARRCGASPPITAPRAECGCGGRGTSEPGIAVRRSDERGAPGVNAGHEAPGCFAALCLRVLAQPDPAALARVLSYFQILNVVPQRVVAELDSCGAQHIRVETRGLSPHQLAVIGAKLAEHPAVEQAEWSPLDPG